MALFLWEKIFAQTSRKGFQESFAEFRLQWFYCNLCKTSFTGLSGRQRNQAKSKDNKTILRYLLLGNSIRALAEGSDVTAQTIYNMIDFFHEQFMQFAAERESKLEDLELDQLYLF